MRNELNIDNYIQCLFTFTYAFDKEVDTLQLMQRNKISNILTPSDEAFMLLCISVYYKNFCDMKADVKEQSVSFFSTTIMII